ncbi:hypothetical protein STEG23_005312 [Scotinomys teguina]
MERGSIHQRQQRYQGPKISREREAVTVGGLDPPSPRRPPSAGRAQPPSSSGIRVSPDRLKSKGNCEDYEGERLPVELNCVYSVHLDVLFTVG